MDVGYIHKQVHVHPFVGSHFKVYKSVELLQAFSVSLLHICHDWSEIFLWCPVFDHSIPLSMRSLIMFREVGLIRFI